MNLIKRMNCLICVLITLFMKRTGECLEFRRSNFPLLITEDALGIAISVPSPFIRVGVFRQEASSLS